MSEEQTPQVIVFSGRVSEEEQKGRLCSPRPGVRLRDPLSYHSVVLPVATQERDECRAKFDRQTILYDNSILVDPSKIWIIPVDVEPMATLSVTHTTTRRPSARLSASILSGNSQHERGYQCRIRGLSA